MDFSPTQYRAVVEALTSGLDDLTAELDKVASAANYPASQWYVPKPIAEAVLRLGSEILRIGIWIRDKIKELLEGVAAPVFFYDDARHWQRIRGLVTAVVGDLRPETLTVSYSWHGEAADAYARQINPQTDAAARVATTMDKLATSLNQSAAAGLAFYLALGLILIKCIMATSAAIASMVTVVFSWIGVAIVIEELAVNVTLIFGILGGLTVFLTNQLGQINTLQGELVDMSTFPHGQWPNATTARFTDAAVSDGDADWSLDK